MYVARRSLDRLPDVAMEPAAITRDYDFFFAPFLFPAETLYLNKLPGWRERSRRAACFLGEVWTKDAEALKKFAPILKVLG